VFSGVLQTQHTKRNAGRWVYTAVLRKRFRARSPLVGGFTRSVLGNASAVSDAPHSLADRFRVSELGRIRYSRLQEAASGGGGCGTPYGISIDFRLESLARSGFCQKGSY